MAHNDVTLKDLKAISRYNDAHETEKMFRYAQSISALSPYLFSMPSGHYSTLKAINSALETVTGLSLRALIHNRQLARDDSRIAQLKHGMKDEKAGAAPVKSGLVVSKSFAGLPVYLHNDQDYYVLKYGANNHFLLIDFAKHTSVLVVENWLAFQEIDSCELDMSCLGTNPLIVYRGDPQFPIGAYKTLCQYVHERFVNIPIIAFMDLDPEGIGLSDEIPGLHRLLYENPEKLNLDLSSTDTFMLQRGTPKRINWSPKNRACLSIWNWLIANEIAIQQEAFFNDISDVQ